MQENISKELIRIIAASLTGNIVAHEEATLEKWIGEDISHRRFYENLKNGDNFPAFYARMNEIDPQKELGRFISRVEGRSSRAKLRRLIPFAAAAAVVVGIIIGIGLNRTQDSAPVLAAIPSDITPGSTKAMLILPEGQVVELGEGSSLAQAGFSYDGTSLVYSGGAAAEITPQIHTLYVPRGGEHQVVLPDGTRVWLNSDTELKYPDRFTGAVREVELSGEAYFDVVANGSGLPFVVRTNGMDIKVLGTEFNINAYKGTGVITATLVNGSIEATAEGHAPVLITPEHQLEFNKADSELNYRKVPLSPYISWKDGKFVFYHEKLGDVADKLSKWYDVDIYFEADTLRDIKVLVVVGKYGNIDTVLDVIRSAKVADFSYDGEKIMVVHPGKAKN